MKQLITRPGQDIIHNFFLSYTRHFPINRGKARLIQRFWKLFSFNHFTRTITLRRTNTILECDLSKHIQREVYFRGIYEAELISLWLRLATKAKIIFDIGANIGLYSLLASSVNSLCQIHAFEPTPCIVDQFQKNLLLNDFKNIQINSVAVGSTARKAFLHISSGRNQDNEGMNFVTKDNLNSSDFPVEIVTITDYCKQKSIDFIDLVKIDIEGSEYDALTGSYSLLSNHSIGCIFLELVEWSAQRGGSSTAAIKNLLMDMGYRLYCLKGNQLVLASNQIDDVQNIIAVAEGYDLPLKN